MVHSRFGGISIGFSKPVKVNGSSSTSSRLAATAGHFSRHLQMKVLRFASISCFASA